jgi:hypothetical protein
MKPGIVNLVCPQGATFRRTLTWKIGNTPINLTGYSARMQVREAYDSSSFLLSLTSSNAGITLGGPLGTIVFYISNIDTSNIRAGVYVYDLELIAPNGDVTRLIQGKFDTTPEVTR